MKSDKSKDAGKVVDELADPQARITDRIFFDVSFDDTQATQQTDRIIIGLYGDIAPQTVKNFKTLCDGQLKSAKTAQQLSYQGSKFHRVIPGFMIQGGDFTKKDGTGGESIFGSPFADESFALKHTGLGVVSMANKGTNTNTSQFFICTAPCSWLDGKHVVFGQVIHGMHVLRRIEAQGSRSGQPASQMTIVRCGVLPALKDSVAANPPSAEDLDEEGRVRNRIMK
ncbi:peptidylprolyl isomerase [archaeon]|nr:MAG: peptidylprolyl isomerase [archaeon]